MTAMTSKEWDAYFEGDYIDLEWVTKIRADLAAKERESADLALRLEQMRGYASHKYYCPAARNAWNDEKASCTCGFDAVLSAPPGELAREVREALKYYANDGLYVQMVVDGVASPAGAKAREVLAKMGGEG
jgi:hypothetical protein